MAHDQLQLGEVGSDHVDVPRMAEIVDAHRRPVRRAVDADRHVELDALRIQRVVAAVVGGQPDHERPHAQAPEATATHELLELAHCLHPARDVRAGKRYEPVRVPLRKRGDDVVGYEGLVHARPLVEAGDQGSVDPCRVEHRDQVLLAHLHAGGGARELRPVGFALVEDA
jgi:hypothetical protein